MSARPWAQVAQLISSQGLKGRLTVRSVRGLPFFLEPGMEVRFVPPTLDAPRSAKVESVEEGAGGDWRVSFSGISDRGTADKLSGSFCLVKRDLLPEDYERMGAYGWEYIGCEVVDATYGNLGHVTEVRPMPTQDLLIVDGPFGEVLIPAVEEFILAVDVQDALIETSVPSGLLSLPTEE